jgi:hypothetical protein
LDEKIQRDGCGEHLLIPSLVPYGEPIDGGETWVAYKHRQSGAMFVNGHEGIRDYGPIFSSKELHNCPAELIADMAGLKDTFPGSKVVEGAAKFVDPLPGLESDDLDAIPTKPPTDAEKKARRQNRAMVDAMQEFAKK